MADSTRKPTRGSHAGRILTLSLHAFTQLVRMKVNYFLWVFAVIVICSNFFNLPQHLGPESAGLAILGNIKSVSLGSMTLFALVISVVATALLLPRDIEDRTLYTILAKPVPRIDYLVGRLLGVLLLVFVSLAVMDLLMVGVIHVRTGMILEAQEQWAMARGWPQEAIDSMREDTLAMGANWELQAAVLAIFLKAAVTASLVLLCSTFSSSTLFSVVVGLFFYVTGHVQSFAIDFYLQGGEAGQTAFSQYVALVFGLIIPNFQLFNVTDSLAQSVPLSFWLFAKLVVVACYHVLVYTLLAWWVFADKEV
ncbi:MAG: hypothetical protein R3242_06370 [Akkermansiaceae bacterium]|nr:hypothetical protein [Akkermansiaceae bacterium]